MDSEKIKEKIKIAEETVKDMQDAELKKKAFEVILNKLITPEIEVPSRKQNNTQQQEEIKNQDSTEKTPSQDFNPEKLTEATGMPIDRLGSVIDFDGNDFHVVAQIPGKSHSEKQKNAALVIITTNYYCTGNRDYDAGKLRKRLEDLGIKSLVNMATILQNFENYFVKKGEQGSKSTAYRITNPGLQEGIKLIRQLGENNEQ